MLRRRPGSRRPSRLARLRSEPERGSAATELVLATPLLLLLIMGVVQFALYYHGAQVAQAAASQAVAVARAQGATSATGQSEGQAILDQVAGGTLPQRSITVTRSAAEADANVSGTVQSLVPGLHLHVSAHAAAPVEAWTKN